MIVARSRYVTGTVFRQPDRTVGVRRSFAVPQQDTLLYTWNASDRLDRIAAAYLGRAEDWWKILDANPLVQDPHDIRPGEQIRIPARA